ncbi:MAG: hypothetical protein KAX49_12605 [Halanaerobiales bacterium]|nr:hypothetical protein [Halanaerobiales bacterium]
MKTNDVFGIWSPLAIIRANNDRIHYKNLFYVIQSKCFKIQVENYWSFGTQPNIGMGTLEHLFIPYSTHDLEQKTIAQFLDAKVSELDRTINLVYEQIDKLKQAKQALISEVVTGKIDLRDWEIIVKEVEQ